MYHYAIFVEDLLHGGKGGLIKKKRTGKYKRNNNTHLLTSQ